MLAGLVIGVKYPALVWVGVLGMAGEVVACVDRKQREGGQPDAVAARVPEGCDTHGE